MRTVGTLFRNIDTRDVFYIDWWLGSDISCQRASASFSKAIKVNKPTLWTDFHRRQPATIQSKTDCPNKIRCQSNFSHFANTILQGEHFVRRRPSVQDCRTLAPLYGLVWMNRWVGSEGHWHRSCDTRTIRLNWPAGTMMREARRAQRELAPFPSPMKEKQEMESMIRNQNSEVETCSAPSCVFSMSWDECTICHNLWLCSCTAYR